jgi:NADP-dependent 3-hydroxy acid dehydrogenase YdfG
MRGNVIVITGATSCIGQIAAERLGRMDARIVLVARDEAMPARLRERAPDVPTPFTTPIRPGLPR